MATFNSGVSAGTAVNNQANGVTLSQAGDYAVLYVSNASPPGGPDAAVTITLSGAPVGATVSIQKQYAAGTSLTNLDSLQVSATGAPVGSTYVVPATGSVDLLADNISGLYAIRVTLNGITSGGVLVQGLSTPGNVSTTDVAILGQVTLNTTLAKALVLALSDMNNTDYLAAVGGSD